jgi:hypothetical protein
MVRGPTWTPPRPAGTWSRSRRAGDTSRRHQSLARNSPPNGTTPKASSRRRLSLARGPRTGPLSSSPRGRARQFSLVRTKPRGEAMFRPSTTPRPRASTPSSLPRGLPRRSNSPVFTVPRRAQAAGGGHVRRPHPRAPPRDWPVAPPAVSTRPTDGFTSAARPPAPRLPLPAGG